MRSTRIGRATSLLAVLGIVIAALFAASSTAAGPTVRIKGSTLATYHFKPKTVNVSKGTTVHWSWSSNAPHNVTFSKLGKHSATGSSGTYKLTFNHRGTFRYLCTVHGFRGKVVVG
jgi:plastocyanin